MKTILTILIFSFCAVGYTWAQAASPNRLNEKEFAMIVQFFDLNNSKALGRSNWDKAKNCNPHNLQKKLANGMTIKARPIDFFLHTGFSFTLQDKGEYRLTEFAPLAPTVLLSQWQLYNPVNPLAKENFIRKPYQIRFPKGFFNAFPYLKRVHLAYANITQLPDNISNCSYLQYLELTDNPIKRLPEQIGKLGQLEYLSVQRSHLTSLPASVGQLKQLRELYLSAAALQSLPPELFRLKHLRSLLIDRNPSLNTENLLPELSKLQQLNKLQLPNNAFKNCILPLPMTALLEKNFKTAIDQIPQNSKLVAYTGSQVPLSQNVLHALYLKKQPKAKTAQLHVGSQQKLHQLSQNIPIIVAHFKHPQGDFYKAFSSNQRVLRSAGPFYGPSVFDASLCPAPAAIHMPKRLNLKLSKLHVIVNKEVKPEIEFPEIDQPDKYIDYLKLIRYTVSDRKLARITHRNTVLPIAPGKLTVTAHSGKAQSSATLHIEPDLPKPSFYIHPNLISMRQVPTYKLSQPHLDTNGQKRAYLAYQAHTTSPKFFFTIDFRNSASMETIPELSISVENPQVSVQIKREPTTTSDSQTKRQRYSIQCTHIPENTKQLQLSVRLKGEPRSPSDDRLKLVLVRIAPPKFSFPKAETLGKHRFKRLTDKPNTLYIKLGASKKYLSQASLHFLEGAEILKGQQPNGVFPQNDIESPGVLKAQLAFQQAGFVQLELRLNFLGHPYSWKYKHHMQAVNAYSYLRNFQPKLLIQNQEYPLSYETDATEPISPIWKITRKGAPANRHFWLSQTAENNALKAFKPGDYLFSTKLPGRQEPTTFEVQVLPEIQACTLQATDIQESGNPFDYQVWTTPSTPLKTAKQVVQVLLTQYDFHSQNLLQTNVLATQKLSAAATYKVHAQLPNGVKCLIQNTDQEPLTQLRVVSPLHKLRVQKSYLPLQTSSHLVAIHNAHAANQNNLTPRIQLEATDLQNQAVQAVERYQFVLNPSSLQRQQWVANQKNNWQSNLNESPAPTVFPKESSLLELHLKKGIETGLKIKISLFHPLHTDSLLHQDTLFVEATPQQHLHQSNIKHRDHSILPATATLVSLHGEAVQLDFSPVVAQQNRLLIAPIFTYSLKKGGKVYQSGSLTNSLRFPKLPVGSYQLSSQMTGLLGIPGPVTHTNFEVLPPFSLHLKADTVIPAGAAWPLAAYIKPNLPTAFQGHQLKLYENGKLNYTSDTLQPGYHTLPVKLNASNEVRTLNIQAQSTVFPNLRSFFKPLSLRILPPIRKLLAALPNHLSVGSMLALQLQTEPQSAWTKGLEFLQVLNAQGEPSPARIEKKNATLYHIQFTEHGKLQLHFRDTHTGKLLTLPVTVRPALHQLKLPSKLELGAAESLQLKPQMQPTSYNPKMLKWQIIGETHGCTLSPNGLFQAGSWEQTNLKTIKVRVTGPEARLQSNICKIFIHKKVEKLELYVDNPPFEHRYNKNRREPIQIKARIYPSNASNPKLTWHIRSIYANASINQQGQVFAAGLAGKSTVYATAQDGSGLRANLQIKFNTYPTQLKLQLPKYMFLNKLYSYQTQLTPRNLHQHYFLRWEGATDAFTSSSKEFMPLKLGKHTLIRQHSFGRPGQQLSDTVEIQVFDKFNSVDIKIQDKATVAQTLPFTAELRPYIRFSEPLKWQLTPSTQNSPAGKALLLNSNELRAVQPGWVSLKVRTPRISSTELPKQDEVELPILAPDTALHFQLLPKRKGKTIRLHQQPDEFVYHASVWQNYYKLQINYYDNQGELYKQSEQFMSRTTPQLAEASRAGYLTFSVRSTVLPSCEYVRDTLFIQPPQTKLRKDTNFVGKPRLFEVSPQKALWVKQHSQKGFLKIQRFSAFKISITPLRTGNYTVTTLPSGIQPSAAKPDQVLGIDSVHVRQGITHAKLDIPVQPIPVSQEARIRLTALRTDFKHSYELHVTPEPTLFKKISAKEWLLQSSIPQTYSLDFVATDGSCYKLSKSIQFFAPLEKLQIAGNIQPLGDTLYVGEKRKLQLQFLPHTASKTAFNWQVDEQHLSLENRLNETPVLVATNRTFETNAYVQVVPQQDSSQIYPWLQLGLQAESLQGHHIPITVVQLVDSIHTNLPDTLYLKTAPVLLHAKATVFPKDAVNRPNNSALIWEIPSTVKQLETNAQGHQSKLQITQAGRYPIRLLARDKGGRQHVHQLTVQQLVTELKLQLERQHVQLPSSQTQISCRAIINTNASNKKLHWKLLNLSEKTVSPSVAKVSDQGIVKVFQPTEKALIVEATANAGLPSEQLTARDTLWVDEYVQNIHFQNLNLIHGEAILLPDSSKIFQVKLFPKTAANQKLTWELQDAQTGAVRIVQQVGQSIIIKAVRSTALKLVVKATDGSGVQAVLPIRVPAHATGLAHNVPTKLQEEQVYQLQTSILPESLPLDSVRYSLWEWQAGSLVPFQNTELLRVNAEGVLQVGSALYPLKRNAIVHIQTLDRYGRKFQNFNPHDYAKGDYTKNPARSKPKLPSLEAYTIKLVNKIRSMKLQANSRLYIGEELSLKLQVLPSYADTSALSWRVSHAGLVQVTAHENRYGVKGVAEGEVELTAQFGTNSEVSNTVNIQIVPRIQDFSITDYQYAYPNQMIAYELQNLRPATAEQVLKWSVIHANGRAVQDEEVATISAKGVLKLGRKALGRFVVKAETAYGFKDLMRSGTLEVVPVVQQLRIAGPARVQRGTNARYGVRLENPKQLTYHPKLFWKANFFPEGSAQLSSAAGDTAVLEALQVGRVQLRATVQDPAQATATHWVQVYDLANDVELSLTGIGRHLSVGATKKLYATVAPRGVQAAVKYEVIEGHEFVTLKNEKLYGVAPGEVRVRAVVQDARAVADTLTVQVVVPTRHLQVKLPKRVAVGQLFQVQSTVDAEATVQSVYYLSLDEKLQLNPSGWAVGSTPGKFQLLVMTTDGSMLQSLQEVEIYQPVTHFKIQLQGVDKVYRGVRKQPSSQYLVVGDTATLRLEAMPPSADNGSFALSEKNGDKTVRTETSTAVHEIKLSAEEALRRSFKLRALDEAGHSDQVNIQFVDWVESVTLPHLRPKLPQHAEVSISPDLVTGVLPAKATDRSIRYWVQPPDLATVDAFGNLESTGKLGRFTVFAQAMDGSGVTDSAVFENIPPRLQLHLMGGGHHLALGAKRGLRVTSFPEELSYQLDILEGGGSILPGPVFKAADQASESRLRARALYKGMPLESLLAVKVSGPSFEFLQDSMELRVGQQVYLPFENYGNTVKWLLNPTSGNTPKVEIAEDGLLTATAYGDLWVVGENDFGGRDSVWVQVKLPVLPNLSSLRLYPNPTVNSWVNVQAADLAPPLRYRIRAVSNGEIVYSGNAAEAAFRISLPAELRSGIYLLQIEDATGKKTQSSFVVLRE